MSDISRPPPIRESIKTPGLGKELRRARQDKGLSMGDSAELLGVSVVQISDWENGYETPSSEMLQRMAEVYSFLNQ